MVVNGTALRRDESQEYRGVPRVRLKAKADPKGPVDVPPTSVQHRS